MHLLKSKKSNKQRDRTNKIVNESMCFQKQTIVSCSMPGFAHQATFSTHGTKHIILTNNRHLKTSQIQECGLR